MQKQVTGYEVLKRRLVSSPFLYILAGILAGIAVARLYVFLGGDLNVRYGGILIHHFFIGILLVMAVSAIMFLFYDKAARSVKLRSFLSFFFGFGVGLIVDEANLLVSTAQLYSLSQYYSVYNVYAEFGVIAVFAVLFFFSLLLDQKRKA